ncbi:MAG: hypothetical protein AAB768_00170 [Patescibacteria group bacterium]
MSNQELKGSIYSNPDITTAAKELVCNPSASTNLLLAIAKTTKAVSEAIRERIQKSLTPAH